MHNQVVHLSISDGVPGIPKKLLPKIFEHYVRDNDMGGAIGLELAIVRTPVELHGGMVEVENPSQGGARFIVMLPV